ncbi:MAG: cation:proton antiporter, partial [Phormidesmis sp.]
MIAVTAIWIALPLFLGFIAYLLPFLDRYLVLATAIISAAYGLYQIAAPSVQSLQLIDSFGVTLIVDSLSGYFVLTNALVTMAVVLYCWPQVVSSQAGSKKNKSAFFFAQLAILHGCVNAVFICADFISLYVALEVIGVAAFLLIVYPRSDRTIWLGLRYLFVSNTAMLFYLMGTVLVYQANSSFAFTGLKSAPTEAIALIFLGLLTKGGVFVSGLWLPATHAEAEAPVSALLSGVVSKTGVFPLVRCALLVEEIEPIVQILGIGTALLGVGGAIFEKDTKRMLAFSSISQMGFILAAPIVAGFYALTHGLAKATLFLTAGQLPARSFYTLQQQTPIQTSLWCVVAAASLSISGLPPLAGFNSKLLTLNQLEGWAGVAFNIAAVGTVIAFAKFIFLPFGQPAASA